MEQILEQIKSGELKSYTTEPLNNAERSVIHETVKNAGLVSKSVTIAGMREKQVEIFCPIQLAEQNLQTNNSFCITKEMVEFFISFSGIPIPSTNPKYIEYYLNLFAKYYDTNLWQIFVDDVKLYGLGHMRSELNNVKTKIIESIRTNSEYVEYCSKKPINIVDLATNNDIYNQTNLSKWFVSIDIKAANWTYLNWVCPNFCNNNQNKVWEIFVKNYTNSNFLAKSKPLREITFGQLGNKKILKEILMLINEINVIVANYFSESMKKVVCTTDEIIYEIDENYNIADFINKVKDIDPTERIFRIEKFRLVQLKPYKYFVKEIICNNSNITTKVQFKMITKRHLAQCIKKYENKLNTLCDLDRKFTFEDEDVTLDDTLRFI